MSFQRSGGNSHSCEKAGQGRLKAVPSASRRAGLVLALCLLFSLFLSAQVAAQVATTASEPRVAAAVSGVGDPKLDARVESLLRQMTLEEKVGQLVQYSAGQATGPGTGRSDYEEMIARGEIGSLLNVIEPKQITAYQKIAVEKSRLHIPILFGLDVIHGFRTEFPIPVGPGILVGSEGGREGIAGGSDGGGGNRNPVDVLAHG